MVFRQCGARCRGSAVAVLDNTSHAISSTWSPEHEQHYSFRAWCQDLRVWLISADLQPPQQASVLVTILGSAARESARSITLAEIQHGGVLHGPALDPATYIAAVDHQICELLGRREETLRDDSSIGFPTQTWRNQHWQMKVARASGAVKHIPSCVGSDAPSSYCRRAT